MLTPTDCIAADFNAEWYLRWKERLKFPAGHHPKLWETAAIADALFERGMLEPGRKGLGMGVGQEVLPSLFASMGVQVTATDQDPTTDDAQKWDNGQLSKGDLSLFKPDLVDRAVYDDLVHYQPYDMNTENESFLGAFDFVWHNCVIGHLGSLEAGIEQLERSAGYLKDGGWLVFTTELNVASLYHTVDRDSDTCFWRLQDLYQLFSRLSENGLSAERLHLRFGEDEEDLRVNYVDPSVVWTLSADHLDDPTFSELKIAIGPFALTQILLCFRKDHAPFDGRQHALDLWDNTQAYQAFVERSPDIAAYKPLPNERDSADTKVEVVGSNLSVTVPAGGMADVTLKFRNTSGMRIYDGGWARPLKRSALVVGTLGPMDRNSAFFDAESWASPNRPATLFVRPEGTTAPPEIGSSVADGGEFEYRFALRAPRQPGRYDEKFGLLFEGLAWLPGAVVTVTVDVV